MRILKIFIFTCVCFSEVENQGLDNEFEDVPVLLGYDLVSSNSNQMMIHDDGANDAPDGEIKVLPSNNYGIRFTNKAKAAIAKMQPDDGRQGFFSPGLSTLEIYSDDSLFLDYGIHNELLDQPLLVGTKKAIHYRVLVNTPHGRHLLLVSMLENLSGNLWNERCGGKLKIFLPDSLRSPDQPRPPDDACLLDDIVINGEVAQREMVMLKFNVLVPHDGDFERFSWFNETHRDVINKLAEWVLEGETFGSSFSLLVTIKERLSRQMYVELVNLVIVRREDTGFVMPSIETYMPQDFFEQDIVAPLYVKSNHGKDVLEIISEINVEWVTEEGIKGRGGRKWESNGKGWQWVDETVTKPAQAVRPKPAVQPARGGGGSSQPTWGGGGSSQPAWGGSGMTWYRSSLAEAEWYFREDPVANAHHSEWHRGGGGHRRGEYFYYMHEQMLARYEAERLSLGLGLTTRFSQGLWDRRISDSYDPRLGSTWATRPPGTINARAMQFMVGSTRNLAFTSASYSGGIDRGIDNLGQEFEQGLHNLGHAAINDLSGGRGVMGSNIAAMRDPIFYRWHGFCSSVFDDYKNRLGQYSEADLSFPGVSVVSASVHSEGVAANTFYTYREMATVGLNSLDSTSPGSRMSVQYLRMNHRPFTWNIVINNDLSIRTPAIVRIFMMPTSEGYTAGYRATIHMDHFYMDLSPGENRISRDEMEAPHLSKSRWSLSHLQDSLMNGQVGRGDFSWGGCGWPRHLNIPRGTERGMPWTLVVMVSQVLPQDIFRLGEWRRNSNLAWSYCGVRNGIVPDSRPMGFPVDREYGNINTLAGNRDNWSVGQVTIVHGTN